MCLPFYFFRCVVAAFTLKIEAKPHATILSAQARVNRWKEKLIVICLASKIYTLCLCASSHIEFKLNKIIVGLKNLLFSAAAANILRTLVVEQNAIVSL